MHITLYGRIPSKKNSRITIYKYGKIINIPSNSYREWHKEQTEYLKIFGPKKTYTHCSLSMTFFFPDKRRSDTINKEESVLDLFVDLGIIKDDDWTCVSTRHIYSGGVDKENPRVEIDIIDLDMESV